MNQNDIRITSQEVKGIPNRVTPKGFLRKEEIPEQQLYSKSRRQPGQTRVEARGTPGEIISNKKEQSYKFEHTGN